MKLSAIIPCRNEAKCGWTARRVLETCPDAEVIVVEDGCTARHGDMPDGVNVIGRRGKSEGKAVGNCFSRDEGIMAATGDCMVILDAHVNFDGPDWADAARTFAATDGIACFHCLGLSEGQMDMAQGNGLYHGARIKWTDVSHSRPRILPGRWADFKPGPIGCLMGGAYVVRKDWYVDGLKRCWRNLVGWGHSEPYISLVNYLAGGECHLLPPRVGHMFRSDSPYQINTGNLVHNQMACLLMVDDPQDKAELGAWLERGSPRPNELWGGMAAVMKWTEELPRKRSWAEYRNQWIVPFLQADENRPRGGVLAALTTRTAVINAVLDAGRYRHYCEIGVRTPADNFDHVQAIEKMGVDPAVTSIYVRRQTSHEFWVGIDMPRLEVVFVDGDHRYPAVREDVTNALRVVGMAGTVIMHDCLPRSFDSALPEKPNNGRAWNGEAWKVFSECLADPELEAICIDCDHGVGIVRNRDPKAKTRAGHVAFSTYPPAPWTLSTARRNELYRVVSPELARTAIDQLTGDRR